ncbi:MAG: DDE-type integrase/transposase/recombinase, partial [Pseudomonadota bacterium]|nr:DDE-type integrase/transposase/recombinase [Pseudomonadota bacterium]
TRLRMEALKLASAETVRDAPRPAELEHFSKEAWAIAQKRLAIIKPFLDDPLRTRADAVKAAGEHGVHVATFYRWVRLFEDSGQTSSLVPDKRGRREGTRLLSDEQETIIQSAIEDNYLNKHRGSALEVVEEAQRMCRLAKLPVPNHNTIRARLRDIPQATVLRRRGRRDLARNRHEPIMGEFPGGDVPLAVVQIDHTQADVMLVDEYTRKPIGRPWLTLALDVCTRIVVGLYITFEKPSYMSAGMCMANALCPKAEYMASLGVSGEWPVWGKPGTVHADNAKEFRGEKLRRACEEYVINLQFRPVLKPHYGAHIERLMGTMASEIRKIPGKTFSNTQQRKGYDSEAEAVMTLREFEAYLVDFIVNKYHVRKHADLGTSPLAAWKRGILGDDTTPGIGTLPLPKDPQRIRLDFLPFTKRTIQPYGVRKDYIDYYDPVLDPYIGVKDEKTKAMPRRMFRYDPGDISGLWFLDPVDGQYVRIAYRDVSHPPISEWELRKAQAMLKAEGVEDIDEAHIFEATERLRARVADAQANTKAARLANTRQPGRRPPPKPKVPRTVPLPEASSEPVVPRAPSTSTSANFEALFDEPVEAFDVALSR